MSARFATPRWFVGLLAGVGVLMVAGLGLGYALAGEAGLAVVLGLVWLGLAVAPYKRGARGWVNAASVALGRRVLWGAEPSTLLLSAHERPAVRKILLLFGAVVLVWPLSHLLFDVWLG